MLLSALVDGEVAVGDGEGEDGHGGAVGVAGAAFVAGPGAVAGLFLEEVAAKGGVDGVPVAAGELPGGLCDVIDVVEVPAGVAFFVAEEEVSAGFDFGGGGLAEEAEGEDACGGGGGVGAALSAVAEAAEESAGADVIVFDVGDASVDGGGGDVGADIGSAAEGHELPAGDGDVGGGIVGGVAPAAFGVGLFSGESLGLED